ncbi:Sensor histidine kinase RcsC [Stutzerimonas stutzeri]
MYRAGSAATRPASSRSTNLLSNALKFTEQGYVRLEVSCTHETDGTPYLRFCVSDSGIGMRAEVLATLFESFSQGDSSTSRRYGGSGLGLAISKELVEMMRGRIEVQSTPGEGSRFSFEYPLHVSAQDDDPMIALLAGRPALLASLDGNGVDAMSQLLQRWGMRTERCLEPERLLDYLSDFSAPPLLVLQAPWPGTPGQWLEQLAAHLEANQRFLLLYPPILEQPQPIAGLRMASLSLPLQSAPLREALQMLYADNLPTPAAPAPDEVAENPPCILVAEDNPVNQMVVRGMLQKRGYTVRLADNGRQAVELYRRDPGSVRLILMDCEMPEVDGYEASRQIPRAGSRTAMAGGADHRRHRPCAGRASPARPCRRHERLHRQAAGKPATLCLPGRLPARRREPTGRIPAPPPLIGSAMLIPHDLLEADTLTRLIEDFVTRDGTDNGDETPLETRVARVRRALDKGEAVIVFDADSQQCQLALRHEVPREWLE